MNNLIFTGDLEAVETDIAQEADENEAEQEDADEVDDAPMTEHERGQLLTVFAALATEIEACITEFELRLVDSYREAGLDFEQFFQSQHNAALENLMELRPLIHQSEQRIFHGSELDASLAIRRLKQRRNEVFLQAEKLLACKSPTTTTP